LGIKNSTYGVVIFSFLILITLLQMKNPGVNKRRVIHLALIIGAAISAYFIYLQAFVISSWCKYCLVVDIGLIIGLGVALKSWKE